MDRELLPGSGSGTQKIQINYSGSTTLRNTISSIQRRKNLIFSIIENKFGFKKANTGTGTDFESDDVRLFCSYC